MNTKMQSMYTGQLALDMAVHICNEFSMYSPSLSQFFDPATTLAQSNFCANLVAKALPRMSVKRLFCMRGSADFGIGGCSGHNVSTFCF